MSQRAVEALLGRLLTDSEFRSRFFEEPVATCAHESLDLTAREVEAVLGIDGSRLEELARELNPKIVRVGFMSPHATATAPKKKSAVTAR